VTTLQIDDPELIAALPEVGQLSFRRKSDGKLFSYLSPSTKEELKKFCRDFFGIILADKAVCPGHTAPLDAFWEAYTAQHSIIVWLGSRGLAGKSTMLGGLSLLELLDGMNVAVLGGSAQQSQRVHEVTKQVWDYTYIVRDAHGVPIARMTGPFRRFLPREPLTWLTKTVHGNWLRALTASTRSARGPHPHRLRLDECDEMDLAVLDAAMGQTLSSTKASGLSFRAQTVLSSTHHYPDGTVTEIKKRAAAHGWPVREWCYKENLEENGGWLAVEEVERKRHEVSESMWEVEYELQEPSSEGRAIDSFAVKRCFNPKYGKVDDVVGRQYTFERPVPGATYVHGADWARDRDYTAIVTIRTDVTPARIVSFERHQKKPYPLMIERLNARIAAYGGEAAHDGTGIGAVVEDYLEEEASAIKMHGMTRTQLFSDWILAIERGDVISPDIASLTADHLYATVDDLYRHSGKGHPPDSLVACAMAWRAHLGKHRDVRPARILRLRRF
jgi:hypothetical protein